MARSPSLTWVGYNLLRLTAIVILCWALAVQFIAIGDDMSAYSDAQSTSTSSSPSSGSTPSYSSSRNPYAAPTRSSSTSTAAIGAVTRTPEKREHHIEIHETYFSKREEGSGNPEETGEANYGLSSVPRQAGGVVFTIFSRLIMVSTLSSLILGQFGWPEMFLYNYLPWMGPQSTPIWLGLIQTIVAIENLRVYAKTSVLLPSFALFAIGLLNLLIGSILLWLARKLPKTPPPALYFNLSTRPLYFRPPPKCYDPILKPKSRQPPISDPESQESSQDQKKLPSSNAKSIGLDSEDEMDNISIRSEEGMNLPIQAQYTTQSQEQKYPRKSPPALTGQASQKEQYTDVSKGGYPTISGGGLTDPSAQVPLGFIERTKDGRKIEFINAENGMPSEPPIPAQNGKAGHEDRPVVVKRSDLPPRSQSRKKAMTIDNPPNPRHKLMDMGARQRADSVDTITLISKGKFPPPGSGNGNGNGLEEAAKHARMRKSTLSSMTFGPLPLTSSLPFKSEKPDPMPGTDQYKNKHVDLVGKDASTGVKRSNSNISSSEKRRQSTSSYLSATLEMGPRFPFPPSRQTSLRKSHKPTYVSLDEKEEGEAESRGQIVDSPGAVEDVGMTVGVGGKGPRPPFRAGSKREKPTMTSTMDEKESRRSSRRADPSTTNEVKEIVEEKKRKFKSPLDLLKSPSIPLPMTPKSPESPKHSSRPTIPRRRSSSSSATSPKVSSGRKRAATLAAPLVNVKPSPSLKRASSARRGLRVARGVRFNLSPTVESHDVGDGQSEWSSSEGSEEEDEVGEVRRLSVRQDMGGVSTPTKKVRRPESVLLDRTVSDREGFRDSRSGDGKTRTRSRTMNEGDRRKEKETRVEEEPKKGKTMILGGDYLSGGKENHL